MIPMIPPVKHYLTPTIGRTVLYRLSADDAVKINKRRADARANLDNHRVAANGVQIHVGNSASEGQELPMVITAVWGNTPDSLVNGQVALDGNDIFWATSVGAGEGPGTWSWPQRS